MQQKHNNQNGRLRLAILLALAAVLALGVFSAGAAPFNGNTTDGQPAGQPASGRLQSYVVLMSDMPLVAYDGSLQGFDATAPTAGAKLNVANAAARSYDSYLRASHERALRGAGLQGSDMLNQYTVALNGFSLLMTKEQAAEMARQPGVLRVNRDVWRTKMTDASPGFLGLDGEGEAWAMGYTGEDVVVGVIDSGIWPEHPSFADDGSYSDLGIELEDTPEFPACDFGNIAANPQRRALRLQQQAHRRPPDVGHLSCHHRPGPRRI